MASWKKLEGTYTVPGKVNLNGKIGSETSITDTQEVRMEEPLPDATFKMDNNTFISEIQEEELLLTNDGDDTLEIFPHKHKASRAKEEHKTFSDVSVDVSKKQP